jgi:hypothetical protein
MIYLGNNEIYDMNNDQIKDFVRKTEKGLISQILDIDGDYILFIENDDHSNKFLIKKSDFSNNEDLKIFKLEE